MPENVNLAEAVKLGQKIGLPVNAEPVHYAVIPNDCKIESLESYQFANAPIRKKATVELYDADSLIKYWVLFSDQDSRLFACPTGSLWFSAILDYHRAGEGEARFRSHIATFNVRMSNEWAIWKGSDGKKMSQVEFATFIEDNSPDVINAAFMKEVATDLQARDEAEFASSTRLDNGQTEFVYQQAIRGTVGKGKMLVPETFKLNIPVFLNESRQEITARLRWRLKEGKLTFWYDLFRAQQIIDDGFNALVTKIALGTGADVLMGTVK